MGLKASVTFGTTISASTTKLSAGFATAGTNIGKILDQAVLLSVSLPMPVEDLKTIKATIAYFTATYVALGAAFMNATGPAIAVTATLNDGVKYLDTFLPAFGLAMSNLETFTSIKLLQFFPSDAQQQGLKVAFTNVFTAVVSLNDKVGVTTADINAVLAAADLKVIQDFYDYYNSAIASVNIQLTIILGQFTGLVTIQTALLKNIVSFPGEMLAWNVKLAAAATKTIPTITASLAAELKAEQTVVTGILAKLVTYVENDEDVNIPGKKRLCFN